MENVKSDMENVSDHDISASSHPFAHLKLRAATNSDRQRIEDLVFGILAEFDLKPDPEVTDADLANIESHYIDRGGLFDLIEDEAGQLIGTVGLYPLDAGTCELRKMYLAPTSRGQGLGKYLLKQTVERARELGFREIVLETSSKLQAAIHLYTQFGFQPHQLKHVTHRADQAYRMRL